MESEEVGEKPVGDKEVQTTNYEINKLWDAKYSLGNIVSNVIISFCDDRW